MRRLAVVGSRGFPEKQLVMDWLAAMVRPTDTLVSGGAVGPDRWAEEYAHAHNLATLVFHPDWGAEGRAAGVKRNATIIANADSLLAFWDGTSRGTLDSIERARKKGIPICIVGPTDKPENIP